MFPGGFHFHNRHDFMKKFLKGKTDTYIFHMSWTGKRLGVSWTQDEFSHSHQGRYYILFNAENKDIKLLFLRQVSKLIAVYICQELRVWLKFFPTRDATSTSVRGVVCGGQMHRVDSKWNLR
jgi:hypothetical protein